MTDTTTGADWEHLLTAAFGRLLDLPFTGADPAADYAVRIGGNMLYETGFGKDPAWVGPAALSGAEPVRWEGFMFDEADGTFAFDAARSIFEFRVPTESRSAFPAAFVDAVDAACFVPRLIRGADLAPLVEQHGIDLTGPAAAGTWSLYFPRLLSDGTLLGALRAACVLGDGPQSLIDFGAEPEEEWQDALDSIPHPGLRAHLAFFFTDGTDGLMPMGEDINLHVLADHDCHAVAGFEDDHGQFDATVVRLSREVSGPRR
ncbi:hypothetical protein ACFXI0_29410 [Kitasatospora indigofera]|uniref:hypothetical protein n=1 Tax=Kitasatospora indigofera TaxID=67307 RepID=UPI003679919E